MKNLKLLLKKEAIAFDNIVDERLKKGFVPDVKISKNYSFFYNNPWRNKFSRRYSIDNKINFVTNEIKKTDTVLEIGCGLGTLSYAIARKGSKITGIDISKKSIKYCNFHKKKYLNNRNNLIFKNTSLEEILNDHKNYCFDKVIFFKTLHHITNLSLNLKKIKKIMNKNSKLIIVEPLRKNFKIENAIFAFLLRLLSDTWIPKSRKFKQIKNSNLSKEIKNIYDEYKYISNNKKQQSPLDNISDDFKKIKKYLNLNYTIKKIIFDDAVKDKIIGGIRGPYYKETMEFINKFDNYLIKKKILTGSTVKIVAELKK